MSTLEIATGWREVKCFVGPRRCHGAPNKSRIVVGGCLGAPPVKLTGSVYIQARQALQV